MTPVTDGTHGPGAPSDVVVQARPLRPGPRSKNEFEQVRTGNTRVSASSVSRIAHACPNGPKYRTFLRFAPRMTCARGHVSPTVSARYG